MIRSSTASGYNSVQVEVHRGDVTRLQESRFLTKYSRHVTYLPLLITTQYEGSILAFLLCQLYFIFSQFERFRCHVPFFSFTSSDFMNAILFF